MTEEATTKNHTPPPRVRCTPLEAHKDRVHVLQYRRPKRTLRSGKNEHLTELEDASRKNSGLWPLPPIERAMLALAHPGHDPMRESEQMVAVRGRCTEWQQAKTF